MPEKCCVCGKEANYSVYPPEILRKNGTKSMFGISKEAVKHYCSKCYKEYFGNIDMKKLP